MSTDAPSKEDRIQPDETDEVTEPERRRSRVRTIAIALAPLALFALLLASGLGKDTRALPSELIGKPAPELSLPRVDADGSIDSDDLAGQVVVLNYWASWCVPCRQEHDDLELAWERYRERGVVVLGVLFEDTPGGAMAFRQELGGDWPIADDPGSKTAIAYGVFGVPETFVIAPDGTISAKTTGAVTYEWLTDEIDAALRKGKVE